MINEISTKTIILIKALDVELKAILSIDLERFKTIKNIKANTKIKQIIVT